MAESKRFYVRRVREDGRDNRGADRPGDFFGVFTKAFTDPHSRGEPHELSEVMVNGVGGSLGARKEAQRLADNLNLAWDAFHQGCDVHWNEAEALAGK